MRALVLLPDRDSRGKKDYTAVFRPEASRFVTAVRDGVVGAVVTVKEIDLGQPPGFRVSDFLGWIDEEQKAGGLDLLAWFGHGLKGYLPQVGRGLYPEMLGSRLASPKRRRVDVALFACSTGDGAGPHGDGGFGDLLRDALCKGGSTACRVLSHTNAGHATWNPNVREFLGAGSDVGGTGGSWVVAPGSPLWGKWKKALRGSLRLRLPLMTTAQVHAELSAT